MAVHGDQARFAAVQQRNKSPAQIIESDGGLIDPDQFGRTSHPIDLLGVRHHEGAHISGAARMVVSNETDTALRRYFFSLNPGLEVRVRNAGVQRMHTVRTVVPVGDAVSRMVEVRLAAGDSEWLVGTPVQISLPSDEAVSTVAVPRDALVERGRQSYVYKVNNDGTAEQVTVQISPHKDALSRSRSGAIDTQRASTTVTGPVGEWIPIGGVTDQTRRASDSIGSHLSTQSRTNDSIWIKADAVP